MEILVREYMPTSTTQHLTRLNEAKRALWVPYLAEVLAPLVLSLAGLEPLWDNSL
jgi:hypothetical protein